MKQTLNLRITGRVQGVWYRAWTKKTAEGLKLDGWVRNRADGSVEAVVSGEDHLIQKLVEQCYDGPPAARVDNIAISGSDEIVPAGFIQKETL